MKATAHAPSKLMIALIWAARIIIGATFVMSGLVKGIDLWGFVYKIEEYLSVWHIESWRSLNFIAAIAVSGTEFVCGAMLMVGAFRRSVAWWLMAMMAGLLPLSAYIMIADPVSDCGCFGDFWVISNTATFLKNVVIVGALIFLIRNNSKATAIYNPYVQWIPMVLCSIYIIIVGLIGYNIQPLVDFRSFPPGAYLLPDEESEDDMATDDLGFVYEKDGVRKVFRLDELPDSTWTFLEREQSSLDHTATEFTIIDDGVDIAPEIIATEGNQMLLTIPDVSRADISYTLLLNEINDFEVSRGGSLVCLVGSGSEGVERWRDLSMAAYPIYAAEPNLVKELARGNMALIHLHDGRVEWKRTVESLSLDSATDSDSGRSGIMSVVVENGGMALLLLSALLVALLFVLAVPGIVIRLVDIFRRGKAANSKK